MKSHNEWEAVQKRKVIKSLGGSHHMLVPLRMDEGLYLLRKSATPGGWALEEQREILVKCQEVFA
jgi:hypothetical protein